MVRQWPGPPSATRSLADPETTPRRLAVALDQFLSAPPPVTNGPLPSATSFEQELLAAYEAAAAVVTAARAKAAGRLARAVKAELPPLRRRW